MATVFREATGARMRSGAKIKSSSWDLGLVLLGEVALLALMTIGRDAGHLQLLRTLLALATTLFVPGYVLTAALLPRRSDLAGPERLAASFGLSWAVIPPLALVLDRLPWGLRPWPTVSALALLSLLCLAVARYRRRAIARETPAEPESPGSIGRRGQRPSGRRRLVLVTLAILLIALVAGALEMVTGARSAGSATEFYLLGQDGLAEGYPRDARVGEPVVVTVGIASHDALPVTYRVEATEGERLIGQTRPTLVESGGDRQFRLSLTPVRSSADEQVTISLYRDRESEAYRTLVLWLNVAPPGQPLAPASEIEGVPP